MKKVTVFASVEVAEVLHDAGVDCVLEWLDRHHKEAFLHYVAYHFEKEILNSIGKDQCLSHFEE
jgi:hypothetical protein